MHSSTVPHLISFMSTLSGPSKRAELVRLSSMLAAMEFMASKGLLPAPQLCVRLQHAAQPDLLSMAVVLAAPRALGLHAGKLTRPCHCRPRLGAPQPPLRFHR